MGNIIIMSLFNPWKGRHLKSKHKPSPFQYSFLKAAQTKVPLYEAYTQIMSYLCRILFKLSNIPASMKSVFRRQALQDEKARKWLSQYLNPFLTTPTCFNTYSWTNSLEIIFIVFFFSGLHPAVLRAYSLFCSQWPLLVDWREEWIWSPEHQTWVGQIARQMPYRSYYLSSPIKHH